MDGHGAIKRSGQAHEPKPGEAANRPDRERRALLASVLAVTATSLIPSVYPVRAAVSDQDAFMAASKILTGRTSLDPALASRLYDALLADDPRFAAGVQALLTFVNQQKIDLVKLQQVLDDEHSTFAALPRKIVTAG